MEWDNKYNAFNSSKALVHVKYWEQFKDGVIPPPIFVSIDPMNYCNFNCPHCNAKEKLKDKDTMSVETVDMIVATLEKWGTKTVCVGGGGESTLNKNLPYLLTRLNSIGIRIGLVTNGSVLDNYINQIDMFDWIGFSMDAATEETYFKMKGMKFNFERVLENMKTLIQKKSGHTEITYKFLLHPDNTKDVYDSIKLAKETGCSLIHIRPGSYPWFNKSGDFNFSDDVIKDVIEQVDRGREDFADENFKVFGITHKFSVDWQPKKTFKKCYAGATTCVIYPNGDMGLCCDRRGDNSLTLGNISEAEELWGSDRHKEILDKINTKTCPRCTYSHINEIFENVVLDDKMFYDFY